MVKEIEIRVREDLFDKVGVKCGQLYASMNDVYDVNVNGTVTLVHRVLNDGIMKIKANICDNKGRSLYQLRDYGDFEFYVTNYDQFSMYCSNVARFFNTEELAYVEIFPCIVEKEKNDDI